MSDPTTEPQATATVDAQLQDGDAKTFDADYVSKLRAENAKYRTAAKANEEAAKRLADLEESQKTEAQKAAERLAEAERKSAALEAKAAVAEVAAARGVPTALLAGPKDHTPESLQEYAEALLSFRGESASPRAPRPDPNQGRAGGTPASSGEQFAAFFNSHLGR